MGRRHRKYKIPMLVTTKKAEHNHPPMTQYVDPNVDAHNKRNPIDQYPVEEPQHKRFRETKD